MKMKLEVNTPHTHEQLPVKDLKEQKETLAEICQEIVGVLGYTETEVIEVVLTGKEKSYIITLY